MTIVDFTEDKFRKIKCNKKNYKDCEVALLEHFINETTHITKWNDPNAIFNAVIWLRWVLEYMKKNRKKKKSKRRVKQMARRKRHSRTFKRKYSCIV